MSLTVSVALSAAAVPGVNVTATVVLASGATVIGSVDAGMVKSAELGPLIARAEITRFAVPELLIVMVEGLLLVPLSCEPKLTALGLRLIAGATPVPLTPTVCGLPAALSLMFNVADRAPAAAGVKVIAIKAFEPGLIVTGAAGVAANSPAFAPVNVSDEITRSAVPGFVTVTDCAALLVPMS